MLWCLGHLWHTFLLNSLVFFFFFLLVLFLPLPSSLLLLFCFLSDKSICSLCPGDNPVLALRGDLWLVRVNQRLRFLLQVISLGILRYNSGQWDLRGSLLGDFWNSFPFLLKEIHVKRNSSFSASAWRCDAWSCGNNLVMIRANHDDNSQHAENDQVKIWVFDEFLSHWISLPWTSFRWDNTFLII